MPVTDYSNGQYYDPASGQTVSPDEGTGMPGSTSDGPYKFSGIKYGSSNKWGNQALGDAEQYYQRLQSGQDSYAQAMARAKLGQAQQSMAAQAVGRGANPMAERAAIMGGGQAMRQGMVEASAIRAQEMAAAQQAYQNALNTRIGQQQNWAQMELARQQAEADSYYKGREVEMAEDKASQERTSGYINMAGSVVGAVAGVMMSDARLKEDIRSAGADDYYRGGRPAPTPPPTLGEIIRRKVEEKRAAAEQDETARSLALYQYRYRPEVEPMAGSGPGQEHVGVMAQDLASTPIGAHAVQPTSRGLTIDQREAIGLSLGLTGRLGQRADDIEMRLARLEADRGGR